MAQNRDIRRITNNSLVVSPQAALDHERSDSYSPIEESDRIGHGPTYVPKKKLDAISKGYTPTVNGVSSVTTAKDLVTLNLKTDPVMGKGLLLKSKSQVRQ